MFLSVNTKKFLSFFYKQVIITMNVKKEQKNMKDTYLIVSTSILPDYFSKVIEAREMIENGEKSISKACLACGISRSTFYKYRNNIFRPAHKYGKKSILALKMADEKGVLSKILSIIYEYNANVITINEAMPIKNIAYVTITIDISDTDVNLQELTKRLKQVNHVKSANIIAFE